MRAKEGLDVRLSIVTRWPCGDGRGNRYLNDPALISTVNSRYSDMLGGKKKIAMTRLSLYQIWY